MARLVDKGYLIGHIKYSESSAILDFYFQEHGRIKLMAKGIRKKKHISLIPLSFFEIEFSTPKEDSGLGNLYKANQISTVNNAVGNVVVGGLLLFFAEFLAKTTELNFKDRRFYEFINWSEKQLSGKEIDPNAAIIFIHQWGFTYGIDWQELEKELHQSGMPIKSIFREENNFLDHLISKIKRKETLEYMLEMLFRANIIPKNHFNSLDTLSSIW